jgi:hypothetical protein
MKADGPSTEADGVTFENATARASGNLPLTRK